MSSKTPLTDFVQNQLQLQEAEKYLAEEFVTEFVGDQKKVIELINNDRAALKKAMELIADVNTHHLYIRGIARKALKDLEISPQKKEYKI